MVSPRQLCGTGTPALLKLAHLHQFHNFCFRISSGHRLVVHEHVVTAVVTAAADASMYIVNPSYPRHSMQPHWLKDCRLMRCRTHLCRNLCDFSQISWTCTPCPWVKMLATLLLILITKKLCCKLIAQK